MKRNIVVILMLSLILSMNTVINANEIKETRFQDRDVDKTMSEIDEILLKANTPKDVLDNMDDELKTMIYLNSGEDIEYIDVEKEESKDIPMLRSTGYEISDNDLEIKVLAFVHGADQVDIYPSYEWLTPVQPVGKDYFGYTTHTDYSVVPGERSNLLWAKEYASDAWTSVGSMAYTSTAMTGFQHKGSSLGDADWDFYFKGNAYFRADIDSSNPVNKIAIAYVHDTSWTSKFSYSIGYAAAYIGITPSSSNVGYKNDVFYLNY